MWKKIVPTQLQAYFFTFFRTTDALVLLLNFIETVFGAWITQRCWCSLAISLLLSPFGPQLRFCFDDILLLYMHVACGNIPM